MHATNTSRALQAVALPFWFKYHPIIAIYHPKKGIMEMRSPLDALVTEKALHLVSGSGNADLLDHLGVVDQVENVGQIKNVCAKVSSQLADEIDNIVNVLDISKRRFLEAAMIEAVQKAKAIMDAEGVWQALDGQNGWHKVEAEA
ncbi:hypothetical protein [Cupriavidus sp. CuC1]|uniref:hypothetical protein n=1 Tax=Cupriavidus sp. CuC1 TaxID=3373131 RepID=UPI0037D0F722